MVFSSIPFLYYYLPAVLAVYFLVPRQGKNLILLLASLFFYGWGEPACLPLMVLSVAQGYVFGLAMEKSKQQRWKKLWLLLTLACSLGALLWFKYAGFFVGSFAAFTGIPVPALKIALPIGISFYTFQIMSYSVDVYWGKTAAQKNPIHLAAYVSMFPQLIAGPIVRYTDIARQLERRTHSWEKLSLGIRRFLLGLGKKVLIANQLGALCGQYQSLHEPSVLFCWLYACAFTLQIYFDFSGYSDMAIGLGRMLGFDFTENFHYPYVSRSVTEFWRRWHISLGSWFRDYVYIPLGGNRVSRGKWLRNILVVWMLTGFWHGAAWNFVLWGLWYGLLLLGEKLLWGRGLEGRPVLSRVYVMLAVIFGFVLFNAASLSDALDCMSGMLGLGGLPLCSGEALYYLRSYAVVLILAVVGATPLPARAFRRLGERFEGVFTLLEPVGLALILLLSTAYLVDGSFNPFLYFRF
ncbi:MAG: MBOAT family protein [Oscillospiraceae bacterium]|nr:MBOAT family protein [Oscillospiraceae bacterium]